MKQANLLALNLPFFHMMLQRKKDFFTLKFAHGKHLLIDEKEDFYEKKIQYADCGFHVYGNYVCLQQEHRRRGK